VPKLPPEISPRALPALFDVATMGPLQYEKYFCGTPLTRAKRNGLRRNALIAMTVTRDARLDEAIARARQDDDSPIAETLRQIERFRDNRMGSIA
jgi:epoxyqueuosine reductase